MNDYYVYTYITKDCVPYYIGMGRGDRCYRHCNSYDTPVPDRSSVLILFSELSQTAAWLREEILIAMFGRKSEGGTLDNKARGGAGWGGGSPATAERKRKIGDANRGRVLTEEHKQKLSIAKKGKKQSATAVANRVKAINRRITLVSPNGATVSFESSTACAAELSVDRSTISHLKRGKIKSVKGYTLAA